MVVGLWFSAIVAYAQKDTVLLNPSTAPRQTGEVTVAGELSHTDSLKVMKLARKAPKRDWAAWKPDPKRALWLAVVLPGAGQIYNRKYWKLPIFYGGFVGCAYAMRWNNQMYTDYAQAYVDIVDTNESTNSFEQIVPGLKINDSNKERWTQILKGRKDRYRRWRDLSFFCMIGVYGLSIVDAYVDASLSQFDISDDLSLQLEPGFVGTSKEESRKSSNVNPFSTTGIGINAALTF